MAGQRFYDFGQFRLDAAGHILFREGQVVALPPKVAETLLVLVENAGNVVDKECLLKKVWPGAFVEEGSLTRTISVLRKMLGGGADGQQYVATIFKRGYRFVASVEQTSAEGVPSAAGRLMLAVLPFENLSPDKEQEYFSDGLTEEMITQLGQLKPERLGVIARTSAMQYKRTSKSILEIGHELGVSHVIEGSVRRAGNRVRIAAQLIQVNDQTHLWAESYERNLDDILRLQSDVARAIAKQIEIKLAPQEQARLERASQVNPQAYEAYLRGRYLLNHRTEEALRNSIRYFETAIQNAADYAPAYAGLADSYLILQDYGYLPPIQATEKAKRAAGKALEIDETLAEAHTSLAHAYLHDFNWSAARKEFEQAIQLNPSYPAAHFYYANFLLAREDFDEAVAEARRAEELDPVSLPAESNTAIVLYHAGRYDEAIVQSLKVLQTDSRFARAYEDLGRAYEAKGMYKDAIRAYRKAVQISAHNPSYVASLAHGCAASGQRKEALKLLEQLRQVAQKKYVPAYAFAVVAVGLGDKDEAFSWLRKACEERSGAVPFLKVNPRHARLRSDPRFQDLLRRVGLCS